MTLHASKGLEFPVVMIVGVEEGLLPHGDEGSSDIDEERRLFYVGLTRARDVAILLHARSRMQYGKKLRPKPSRFLGDIPSRLVEDHRIDRPLRKADLQLPLF